MGDATSELMDDLQAQSAVRRMVGGVEEKQDRRGGGGSGSGSVGAINGEGEG